MHAVTAVLAVVVIGCFSHHAAAQVLTPVRRTVPAQGREVPTKPRVGIAGEAQSPDDTGDTGAEFLTQAALSAGSTTPEVALQAIDLFFSRHYRFYLRTTLPVTRSEERTDTAAESGSTQISDSLKSALLDEYGGLLYTAAGTYRKLFTGWRPYAEDENHGVFLDARAGAKFVDVSQPAPDTSDDLSESRVAPFYTGMVGVRLVLPLYRDPQASAHHLAGGFSLGIAATGNIAADPDASPLFASDTPEAWRLPRRMGAVNVSMAISLPGLAYVSLTATPWTSADTFGKRFLLSFNLVRPRTEDQ